MRRVAAMSARDIARGDVLVKIGEDQGGYRWDLTTTIGTVLTVEIDPNTPTRYDGDVPVWMVRTPEGDVIRVEAEGTMVHTYVVVPLGEVDGA